MLSRTIKSMRRRMGPLGLSLAAAAVTAVAFAAVSVAQDNGNDSKDDDRGDGPDVFEHRVGPPPELSESEQRQLEEFRQCMQDQGAPAPPSPEELENGERPEPPEPPSEADRDKIQKALEACEDKLPEGAHFGIGPCGPGHGPPPGAPGREQDSEDQGEQQGTVLPAPESPRS